MRQYELTYLISDNVQETELNKITGKIGGYLSNLGGKITKEEVWGRRKLAYPIQKQEFATYVTVYFDLAASAVNEFEREIRLTTEIVRHLLIVQEFEHESLTLTAEDIAESEDIKAVVGGEKSFEAIQGETKESKNLMAVREAVEKEAEIEEEAKPEVKKTKKVEEMEVEKSEVAEDETPAKKAAKKTPVAKAEKVEKALPKPKKNKADESERLSKLNEELDDILKDEI